MEKNEYFKEKAEKVHGNKFNYSLVEYKHSHEKVKIKCPNGHIFDQRPMDHWRGIGCRFCGYKIIENSVKYSKEEIQDKLKNKYPQFQFIIENYKNISSKIKAVCPQHGIIEKKADLFLKGYICEECKGTKKGKLNNDYFKRKSKEIHGNRYDYSLVDVKGAQIKIQIKCKKHGIFNQTPNAHMRGQGCPNCSLSKGELKIKEYLVKNNIKYFQEYSFIDCINPKTNCKLYFDFYLPEKNICIEYQGEFHYNSYERAKGNEGLEIRKYRDQIKRNFCLNSKIELIEIPYWDINKINEILEIIK